MEFGVHLDRTFHWVPTLPRHQWKRVDAAGHRCDWDAQRLSPVQINTQKHVHLVQRREYSSASSQRCRSTQSEGEGGTPKIHHGQAARNSWSKFREPHLAVSRVGPIKTIDTRLGSQPWMDSEGASSRRAATTPAIVLAAVIAVTAAKAKVSSLQATKVTSKCYGANKVVAATLESLIVGVAFSWRLEFKKGKGLVERGEWCWHVVTAIIIAESDSNRIEKEDHQQYSKDSQRPTTRLIII